MLDIESVGILPVEDLINFINDTSEALLRSMPEDILKPILERIKSGR